VTYECRATGIACGQTDPLGVAEEGAGVPAGDM
jgi:hypothetical protein